MVERLGEFLSSSFADVFFKLCNMDTNPHWLSKQDIFSGSFPLFKIFAEQEFFGFVFVLPTYISNGASLRNNGECVIRPAFRLRAVSLLL